MTEKITIQDIIAVSLDTAKHSIPLPVGVLEFTPLSLHRLISLIRINPALVNIFDSSKSYSTADEIFEAYGKQAIIDVISVCADKAKWRVKLLTKPMLAYAFSQILEVSFGSLDFKKIFGEMNSRSQSLGSNNTLSQKSDPKAYLLMLVKLADRYTITSGRDGMSLTPARLSFLAYTMSEISRDERLNIYRAAATVMSEGEDAVNELLEI